MIKMIISSTSHSSSQSTVQCWEVSPFTPGYSEIAARLTVSVTRPDIWVRRERSVASYSYTVTVTVTTQHQANAGLLRFTMNVFYVISFQRMMKKQKSYNSLTSGGFQPLLLHVVRSCCEGGDHEIVEYHIRVRLILHHV